MLLATSLLKLGFIAGTAQAYWRLSCGIIQSSRIDPVINPGSLSPHAHKITGASNVDANSNFDSLQKTKCTSCEVGADKSVYWTPILYYRHPNGSFEEVPNQGMAVYYEGRGDNRSAIQPFPPGFRMISGDIAARSYDKNKLIPLSQRPVADRVSFACLDVGGSQEQPGMVRTSCINGLRAQIHFQSCWDGHTLYKPDNSHVEYMSALDNGICPDSHPVPLVHIFYEVLYSVNNVKQDGGQFVFSHGDTTGYGFHGDFLNGWDPATLASATKNCVNTDGGAVYDCDAFKPTWNPEFGRTCPERPSLVDEPVHGMIDKLPGCITITSGPAPARPEDMNCPPGTPQPHFTSSNGTSSNSGNPVYSAIKSSQLPKASPSYSSTSGYISSSPLSSISSAFLASSSPVLPSVSEYSSSSSPPPSIDDGSASETNTDEPDTNDNGG
ncbi:MAG: hypothetical protein LQ351_003709 [Letrouitia transgressa]|nr:MAG: hypothetical protein LQ351_003709 [Letrouitia transgressa]